MLDTSEYIVAAMLEDGTLDRAVVERARRQAVQDQVSVCEALVSIGAASAKSIALARAALVECGYVDLSHYEIDIRKKKTQDVFRQHRFAAVVHLGIMHDPRVSQVEHHTWNVAGFQRRSGSTGPRRPASAEDCAHAWREGRSRVEIRPESAPPDQDVTRARISVAPRNAAVIAR